ncbi:hypothetical protein ABHE73_003454 [Salmonella enterica]
MTERNVMVTLIKVCMPVFAGQQVSTGEGRGFSYLLLTLVKVNNRKDRIF